MKKCAFQLIVGFAWFGFQTWTIVYAFILQQKGGFTFEEFTTTAAIIGPMFLGFTAAFVSLVIATNRPTSALKDGEVSIPFAVLTGMLILIFVIALNCLVYTKAHSPAMTFEQFKLTVAVLQTFFGAFVGAVLGELFGVKSSMPTAEQITRAGHK